MTLADLSVITAEVKVDETDIVNVSMGQPVDVSVDALPGRVFPGVVTEVGDQAILRSTGIATSQSTTGTEEAKDFKVVVTLTNPPRSCGRDCRPPPRSPPRGGKTWWRFPFRLWTMRDPASLNGASMQTVNAASNADGGAPGGADPTTQGVFLMRSHGSKLESQFVPVTTGITGAPTSKSPVA
jgi:HlyD family secretion protein